ncbi:hypothetical protein [Enterococcus sp. LJL90]
MNAVEIPRQVRVTYDVKLNIFLVYAKNDPQKFATGITIEKAIQNLYQAA